MTKPQTITARINKALKRLGREEKFVRGDGYYYVTGGMKAAGLYVFRLDHSSEGDLQMAVEYVESVFAEEGEPLKLGKV